MDVGIANDSFSIARQMIVLWKVEKMIGSISQIVLRKQFAPPHITMVAFDIDLMTRHVLQ